MKRYFKGWYFKAENDHQMAAVIPAVHMDESRKRSASIQVITGNGAWCAWFPYEQFSCNDGDTLRVTVGENTFSEHGIKLNINSDPVAAFGALDFGPLSPIRYDIMGPFHYVPFMECRHSVFSMTHTTNGQISINGEMYRFDNHTGYIEGDRGRSFPKVYSWTQCNFFDYSPCSLMLSVAEIPMGMIRFTGIIGVILWRGREYRIATYLGAKAAALTGGKVVVTQGKLRFTAELVSRRDRLLYAPVGGNMKRMIHESPLCTARYCLEESGRKLFEFQTDRASFEYEYDR